MKIHFYSSNDTLEFSSKFYKSMKFGINVPFGIKKPFRLDVKICICFSSATFFGTAVFVDSGFYTLSKSTGNLKKRLKVNGCDFSENQQFSYKKICPLCEYIVIARHVTSLSAPRIRGYDLALRAHLSYV